MQDQESNKDKKINDTNFLRKTFLGSILFGSVLWPFVPILSPLIISIAPVVLCFYFIKDSTVQYKNNLLFLTGSFAGYIAIFTAIVYLMPSHEIRIRFYGENQKEKIIPSESLLITSSIDKKEISSMDYVTAKAILQRSVCSTDLGFLCDIIPFKFYENTIQIKTLTGDYHKDRDLTINLDPQLEKNLISVIEQTQESEDRNTFKVGLLKNNDLSENGFINLNADDNILVKNLIKNLNDLASKGELDNPVLKVIREACTSSPENFCRFPIREVTVELIEDNPVGQATVCNRNEIFKDYFGHTIELSLIKNSNANGLDTLESIIPLELKPVVNRINSNLYRAICSGDNRHKLIRINPVDFEKMISGVPKNKCKELDKLNNFRYGGYANISISVLSSQHNPEYQEESSKLPIAKRICL